MQPISSAEKSASRQARRAIDGALTRDRGRLLGLWSKWNAKPGDAPLREAFVAKLQASVAEREARQGRVVGPHALHPLYVRRPDVEVARDRARVGQPH